MGLSRSFAILLVLTLALGSGVARAEDEPSKPELVVAVLDFQAAAIGHSETVAFESGRFVCRAALPMMHPADKSMAEKRCPPGLCTETRSKEVLDHIERLTFIMPLVLSHTRAER